ncbi:MAG: hypothetical protein LC754_04935 [Acidobacteria bacterium]|nr:hypothetical protein [Acidobacteriota bacterium]
MEKAPAPVAHESEVACGGFITQAPPSTQFEIVGSEEEQEQRLYSEGDYVFINAGASEGMKVGQEFSAVRPRGRFKSTFSKKKGSLGIYTQELGWLRVVRVRNHVSVAFVVHSCDNLLNGDLLRAVQQRLTPASRQDAVLDRFAEPTGKQTGRIVLARDGREALTRDDVVFIDLGAEDNVKPGDYLTVFRPAGKGIIVEYGAEITANARRGYESNHFHGGKLSNQAQRLKDPGAGMLHSETVTTPGIRKRRPPVPRKIVGEIVVLHVEGRTATAVLTRVAQEVHPGDFVELQ